MSKVRVPLHGKPHGYATLDTEATRGAVVGVNLFWPDGRTVVTEAALAAASGAPPPGEGATVFWRTIQEIPVNVKAVAGLASNGFVRRNGDAWSAGPIINDDLGDASTDGLQEGATNLYFTDQRARDAAPIQSIVAGANVSVDVTDPANPVVSAAGGGGGGGGVLPVVTGEIDNGQPVFVYADDGSLIYSEVA